MLLFSNSTRFKLSPSFFSRLLGKVERTLSIHLDAVSLNLVGLKTMTRLNQSYRHKSGPTDTISFAFKANQRFPGENLLGEIFICPAVIKSQAKKYGKTFHAELSSVFVHSVLHLLGFTHETKRKLAKMQALTEKIITSNSSSCEK